MTEYKRAAKAALSFSKPLPDAKLRVISLGAGVQSSVMALMAAKGEVGPMPDCAIFADTQWEPKEVYTHLDWLEKQLPFPVHRVTAGNIRADHVSLAKGERKRVGFMPLYGGGMGIGRRHCTKEYKIEPVLKNIRELLGLKYRQRAPKTPVVESWLGISTDEMQRLKLAHEKYISHRWPLIEESMARSDCLKWFTNNYPNRVLAKSACVGCPFHTDAEWRRIRDEMPDAWADAIEFDKVIRNAGIGSARKAQYLHRSSVPLDEVDLSTAADKGQQEFGFLEECEGMCGI
tara:strand:- start:4855 stop:5721 length:867 start_codon:yes stop_codon:yes gene_type:complete